LIGIGIGCLLYSIRQTSLMPHKDERVLYFEWSLSAPEFVLVKVLSGFVRQSEVITKVRPLELEDATIGWTAKKLHHYPRHLALPF
jgi:hypothetical protein